VSKLSKECIYILFLKIVSKLSKECIYVNDLIESNNSIKTLICNNNNN
jgi:hypothetical protein